MYCLHNIMVKFYKYYNIHINTLSIYPVDLFKLLNIYSINYEDNILQK